MAVERLTLLYDKWHSIMSSITKKKVKGITYVYEQTATYNAEKTDSQKTSFNREAGRDNRQNYPGQKKHEVTITETVIYEAPKEKIKATSKKPDKY